MLERMRHIGNEPLPCNQVSAPQSSKIDLERELKIGVELICDLNKKLNDLSWAARDIIHTWLKGDMR